MIKFDTFTERFKSTFFPSKEDLLWKEWVDSKKRDKRDLVDLLSSNESEDFKKRAIYLLLVPSKKIKRYYWKRFVPAALEDEIFQFKSPVFIDDLEAKYLNYTKDLIILFRKKYSWYLQFYDRCILSLLARLSEEKGEEIFPFYSFYISRDFSPYYNDESSYIRTLRTIPLSHYWEERVKSILRKKIEETWELKERSLLLIQYIRIVYRVAGRYLFVSKEEAAESILFVLMMTKSFGKERIKEKGDIFCEYIIFLERLLLLLKAEKYQTIRYELTKQVLFHWRGGYFRPPSFLSVTGRFGDLMSTVRDYGTNGDSILKEKVITIWDSHSKAVKETEEANERRRNDPYEDSLVERRAHELRC